MTHTSKSSSSNTSETWSDLVDTFSPSPEAPAHSGTPLKIKRIDKARIPATGDWEFYDSTDPAPKTQAAKEKHSELAEYIIVVQRKFVQSSPGSDTPTIKIKLLIQSDFLLKVAQDVLKDVQHMSWNIRPFKVDPQLLLAFLSRFRKYLEDVQSRPTSNESVNTVEHLSFLTSFLETEYATTLKKIDELTSHGEITFDLLWSILLPSSIIFIPCETTSEPRAVRLLWIQRGLTDENEPVWRLNCEYVETNEDFEAGGPPFRLATIRLEIANFDGVRNIADLSAYPIERHHEHDMIREKLIERGRKWGDLRGVHHMRYNSVAYRRTRREVFKVKVNGRIMIDRRTFADAESDYRRQLARNDFMEVLFRNPGSKARTTRVLKQDHLEDDDALLASPIVYGFSLVDKLCLEFNVEHVNPIEWNDDAFENLAIDPNRKLLVRSLVGAHAQGNSFDDFVEGKGLGLVFNLFGPPGVGKSLTAEATSEYLRKPLYVVGAGDLGTNAATLDAALTKIFSMASAWNAVVLIDEADVFLEARTSADLERNSVVSVFLRQIEYFRSVLFLTTNRVKEFDRAFQSRIHLSLPYDNLSRDAKDKIWRAFLAKASKNPFGTQELTADDVRKLSEKQLNGRQIKNAVKIAAALANYEEKALGFDHLMQVVDMSEALNQ